MAKMFIVVGTVVEAPYEQIINEKFTKRTIQIQEETMYKGTPYRDNFTIDFVGNALTNLPLDPSLLGCIVSVEGTLKGSKTERGSFINLRGENLKIISSNGNYELEKPLPPPTVETSRGYEVADDDLPF